MKRVLLGAVIAPIVAFGIVSATHEPKVWICKFVGKPGIDERLQTGQNPIDVSENAIKNFQGVGSYFADAQGRSYVLAIDNGQTPDVSECPTPQTPPIVPPVTPPTTPPTTPSPIDNPTAEENAPAFSGVGK